MKKYVFIFIAVVTLAIPLIVGFNSVREEQGSVLFGIPMNTSVNGFIKKYIANFGGVKSGNSIEELESVTYVYGDKECVDSVVIVFKDTLPTGEDMEMLINDRAFFYHEFMSMGYIIENQRLIVDDTVFEYLVHDFNGQFETVTYVNKK